MPMIVDLSAPQVTPPERVTSPDGWFAAVVDATWAGVVLAVDYTASTPLSGAADVRKVRIVRTDPGTAVPVPVRSADLAWAVEGVGTAYDHEAPLGVGVVYTATPQYADGTWGPSSSLAVTVPSPVLPADVWIKSLDTPALSARVTALSWPTLSWAARSESANPRGGAFPMVGQDVYSAATSDLVVDAKGPEIERLRLLLLTPGVLLLQTRPETHRPDAFVVLGDVEEELDGPPEETRTFTTSVTEVARPDTAGQPMRAPGWTYDSLPDQFATYDAVTGSYASYAALSTDGVT